jgi:uncharacterized protein YkwD
VKRSPFSTAAAVAVAFSLFVVGCRPDADAGPPASAAPVPAPKGPLTLEQAEHYVLKLVNHDRGEHGLSAVTWDDTAAHAGLRHAEDMARRGYTAHWGSDGSVPEQRYTEAGGEDMVQENAACFFDGQARKLDPNPRFSPALLQQIESAFMNETPPNDGHRKNILKTTHNRVGIGLAKPVGIDQPCMSQEFVDDFGDYGSLPRHAHVGQSIVVKGTLDGAVQFGGVGLARVALAHPLTARHLNSTSVYPVPAPYVMYFPAGFKTPKPVSLSGRSFHITVKLDDAGRPGRYEVSVWAKHRGEKDLTMVSLRTVDVDK